MPLSATSAAMPRAQILSLTTLVPEHLLDTQEVLAQARSHFADKHPDFSRLEPVFSNTGIARRYSSRPYSWFHDPQGWPERSAAYVEDAQSLLRALAPKALAQAHLNADEIDTIVTVSSTGIATPSLEARILHELGFRDDVQRVPVFGLGCAGGVGGLSLAARLAQANPGSRVLLLVVELCTLAFRQDELSKSNLIATALFGDGAAAAILSTEGTGDIGEVEWTGEHTWAQTQDIMGWRIDPTGFGAIFSRSIPDLVVQRLRATLDAFLARHNLTIDHIAQFVCHPGGAKVVTALERAFGLAYGRLQNERDILRDYGNMSAPTVLFVLDKARHELQRGRRLLSALGPGFSASFVTIQI